MGVATELTMPSKGGFTDFLIDFLAGGVSGAVSKTITAPIERVKLVIQTQDANPKIKSGEVPRYTGIGNCFTRIKAEQASVPSGVATELTSSVTSPHRLSTLPSRTPSRLPSLSTTTRPTSGSSLPCSLPPVALLVPHPSPLCTHSTTLVPAWHPMSEVARSSSRVLLTA